MRKYCITIPQNMGGFVGISVRVLIIAAFVCLRPSFSHAFSYAEDVPNYQQWMMESDLKYLERVPGTLSSPFLAKIMRHQEFGAGHLMAWLEGRMKVITGAAFRLNVTTAGESANEENFAYTETTNAMDTRSQVLLTNFGAPIYAAGKRRALFYQVEVPGVGNIVVDSPRVGLVRVTDKLFESIRSQSSKADDSLHSIFRLHNYFHEARHSDGNGESLTMPHVQCPEGHPYAGRYACDYPVNGAYRVGSEILSALANKCTDCSQEEKDILGLFKLDEISRILNFTANTEESDLCKTIREWGRKASFCQHDASEGPSWDDRGEVAK